MRLQAAAACIAILAGCVGEGAEVTQVGNLSLTSPGFGDGGEIPMKHTCDGAGVSPGLRVDGVPENAKTLALIMDDPDAPAGTWVHWVAWNIDPATKTIPEGGKPGIEGRNSWKRTGYGGPCPPSGTHRYVFKLYALDTDLKLRADSGVPELLAAMEGRIVGRTTLTGRYARKKG